MLAKVDRIKLQTICLKWKIKELAVFDSVLQDDFNPDSDVDLTVTFNEDAHWRLWEFYELKEELENVLSSKVKLVEPDGVINPIRRSIILNNRQVIYAA